MGALMTSTSLTYHDLMEASTFMADKLLAAQNQFLDLNQQLAAAQGEVAALRGMLEFEQERTRELRNRGDHWQIVAAEMRPRLGGTGPWWPLHLRPAYSASCAARSGNVERILI